jgi:hypothetical protein
MASRPPFFFWKGVYNVGMESTMTKQGERSYTLWTLLFIIATVLLLVWWTHVAAKSTKRHISGILPVVCIVVACIIVVLSLQRKRSCTSLVVMPAPVSCEPSVVQSPRTDPLSPSVTPADVKMMIDRANREAGTSPW